MPKYMVDQAKWARLSVFEQMGNIGSEVGRALAAKRIGVTQRAEAAFYRGLDLFDVTAQVWATQPGLRLQELLRAREQFVAAMQPMADDDKLEHYFMQFAVVARRRSNL